MQIHELKRKTANKKKVQIGRGGKRGKTSGKGHKGQKARAGRKLRPEIRDTIKKLPKLRGSTASGSLTSIQTPVSVVGLGMLNDAFSNGDMVTPVTLVKKGLISKRGNMFPRVKILLNGEITKKVVVFGCLISKTAKEKIEKVGGTVK